MGVRHDAAEGRLWVCATTGGVHYQLEAAKGVVCRVRCSPQRIPPQVVGCSALVCDRHDLVARPERE